MKNQQKNLNAFLKSLLIVWNQHVCPPFVRNFRQAHWSYEPEATTSWKVPWLLFDIFFLSFFGKYMLPCFFLLLNYIDQTEYVLKFKVAFKS